MKQGMFMVALALGLVAGIAAGLIYAQESAPGQKPRSPALTTPVNSKISYQGVLKENGQPVTGSRQLIFRLYTDATCATQVGSSMAYTVPITRGLFTVGLDVDATDFDGRGLWLETEVNSVSVACQEILPVPYALSLRPGAVISGTADQTLRVNSYASTGSNAAAIAGLMTQAADGIGVFGRSYSTSGSATGVWGITDSSAGRGVYGAATGAGTGVAAYSFLGDAIEAYGPSGSEVFRVGYTGTVTQTRASDGLVKAAAYVSCQGNGSSIIRSFNNAAGDITVVPNSDTGECTIDLGFRVDDRYWTVSTDQDLWGAAPNACTASCVSVAGQPNQLECTRWNDRLGTFQGGNIMIVIY